MSSPYTDVESVAKRYAHRPGCRFLGAEEVGIAVFLMDLRIIVVESREIPPIDEFLLRSLALTVEQPGSLSEFLGLDRRTVHNRLVELRRCELIEVDSGPPGSPDGVRCRLTSRGRAATDSLERAELREVTLPGVAFHGFLRRPLLVDEAQLLRPGELSGRQILKIPAMPARPPNPDEIKLGDLAGLVRRHWRVKQRGKPPELVSVRSILKKVRRMFLPAILLQYELLGGNRQRQFAFAVDGVLDEDCERAFTESKGPERVPELSSREHKSTAELASNLLAPHMVKALGPLRDIDNLYDKLDAAEERVLEKEAAFREEARPDTRQLLREELERERADRLVLEENLSKRKVFRLNTNDCRELLSETLKTAKERIVIVSAFLSTYAVDREFLGLLEAALKRGVKVWIAYGLGKRGGRKQEQREQQPDWQRAEEDLSELRRRYKSNLKLRDLGDTHEKILIRDDAFIVSGSFNWLSFKGEVGRGFRREDALRVTDPAVIEEYFLEITRRFVT